MTLKKANQEARTSQISIRITDEITKKLESICENENKKMAGVCYDACKLYAEIYPALQMIKAIKMNPDMTISEEELKKKIYDCMKNTI